MKLRGEVERRLASQRRQERVGPLAREARTRTPARSSGSRYVRSAHPASVMIVAGFELTSTVRMPSARSTRSAWLPE